MKTIDELYTIYTQYPQIITDSRQAATGSIFFALKGENFDGNDFAAKALDAGSNYVVVDNPHVVADDRYILVDNTLHALQDLARIHRSKLTIPVLAITGTNGKTTTKELIKGVLSQKYQVYATLGNLNNHIGVPLTLLAMPQQTQIAVVEMGANHPGEIKNLCEIAQPTHGLITNIGKAHLEGFGGLEGVKRAKKELYDYLEEHGGTIFYHEENPVLSTMVEDMHTTKVDYGNLRSACRGKVISASPYLKVTLDIGQASYDIATHMAGAYNFENLLAAACIGRYFSVSDERIVASLSEYTPQNNRSQIVQTAHNQLLLDYYNANPTSMKESLHNFFEHIQGSQMVILGDMFELGNEAQQEHEAVIEVLRFQKNVTRLVVGKNFYQAAKNTPDILAFNDVEGLKQWINAHSPKGQFILIKGSRGMKLEQLLELL